jgi:hypothetical protein
MKYRLMKGVVMKGTMKKHCVMTWQCISTPQKLLFYITITIWLAARVLVEYLLNLDEMGQEVATLHIIPCHHQ